MIGPKSIGALFQDEARSSLKKQVVKGEEGRVDSYFWSSTVSPQYAWFDESNSISALPEWWSKSLGNYVRGYSGFWDHNVKQIPNSELYRDWTDIYGKGKFYGIGNSSYATSITKVDSQLTIVFPQKTETYDSSHWSDTGTSEGVTLPGPFASNVVIDGIHQFTPGFSAGRPIVSYTKTTDKFFGLRRKKISLQPTVFLS